VPTYLPKIFPKVNNSAKTNAEIMKNKKKNHEKQEIFLHNWIDF
jgi:hypothetical protein